MFNPFQFIYELAVGAFLLGCAVIIFHLWMYRTNTKIAILTIIIFVVGAFILLSSNLAFASKINWGNFNIVF